MSTSKTGAQRFTRPSLLPAHPRRTILMLAIALGASAGLTAWIGKRDARSYVGYIQAHVARVEAPISGRIARIVARPGDWVEPGMEIAVLVDERRAALQQSQLVVVAALQAEIAQARAKAEIDIQWRLKMLDTEILDTRLKSAGLIKQQFASQIEDIAWSDFVEEFDSRSQTASTGQLVTFLSQKNLLEGNQRTRAMLEQASARNAREVCGAQIELCDERLSQLEQLKKELPAKIEEAAGVDELQVKLDAARAELERIESQAEEIPATASGYGTVGNLRGRVGDRLNAGDTLVELLDDDRRFISVKVPAEQLHLFSVGSQLDIVFPNGMKGTGTIGAISPEAVTNDLAGGQSLVELRIEPSGKLWPADLVVGTPVTLRMR
jgi:HlyD family secretion protein